MWNLWISGFPDSQDFFLPQNCHEINQNWTLPLAHEDLSICNLFKGVTNGSCSVNPTMLTRVIVHTIVLDHTFHLVHPWGGMVTGLSLDHRYLKVLKKKNFEISRQKSTFSTQTIKNTVAKKKLGHLYLDNWFGQSQKYAYNYNLTWYT